MKLFFSRISLYLAALAALGFAACVTAPMAQAATLTVPAQYATIQAAVDAAVNGDTVLVSDGTYTGPGDVDIDFTGKGITVASVDGPTKTVIDCGGSSTVNHRGFFLGREEIGAVISGFTVKNGYSTNFGGFFESPTDGSGGGIFISNGSTPGTSVTVQNCIITNCAVSINGGLQGGDGGGLYAYVQSDGAASTVSLINCTITGNTALYSGGGVSADSGYNGGGTGAAITLTGCTISGNNGPTSGGGIYAATNLGTVTLNACAITGNSTGGPGGGVACQISNSGNITLNNLVLTGNTATGPGGGIDMQGEFPSVYILSNCSLTANSAAGGGGIDNASPSNVTLNNIILYGDTGGEYSPGAINGNGDTLRNCDVQGGVPADATDGGGNIDADPKFVDAPADLHLQVGSPCIGAGLLISGVYTDKDGKTRPDPPSIGAYEPAATVTKVATTLTLTSALNPSQINQSVMLTVAVSNGTQTPPTGTVTLSYNGSSLGSGQLDSTGRITFTITGLSAAGSYPFTATYSGDTNNQGSANTITQTVSAATTTHVLWRNTNGTASLWNYSTINGSFTQGTYGPYTNWTAKAVADGGTDGLTRLLWDNTSGSASVWSLNNATGAFTQYTFGPYAGWTAQALSVATDNTTHLLWTNTNGMVSLWNYSTANGSFTQHTYGPYTNWTAKAVADGGTDGKTRLLWVNTNGTASVWSLDNATGAFTQYTVGPYANWSANAVSVGPDNTTHLLWTNTSGMVSLWNYSTTNGSFTQNTYGPYANWTAKAVADGGDGKTRLLWDNTNGTMSLWNLDNVTGAYSQFSFGPYAGWTAAAVSAGP